MAVPSFNFNDGCLRNYISFNHIDDGAFGRTVWVNDMFGHRHHTDCCARCAEYAGVKALMRNVDWVDRNEANRRLETVENAHAVLGA